MGDGRHRTGRPRTERKSSAPYFSFDRQLKRRIVMDLAVLFLLIFQAVWRPRNSFEPRVVNLASTQSALTVAPICETVQCVTHLFKHLRYQDAFLERFRRALRPGSIVDRISDFSFSRSTRFAFQSGEIGLEFTLFIAQPLCEVFGIHA